MDIAFKVQNPNLINYPKFVPNYSEFLRTYYKKEPAFVNGIHEKLTDLVKLAKDSKQKSRSHSFPVMNRDKRHVVHELCELFGVQSEAYDAEPNRNVVATAQKETVLINKTNVKTGDLQKNNVVFLQSWLPSMSLQEIFQREKKIPVLTNAWRLNK